MNPPEDQQDITAEQLMRIAEQAEGPKGYGITANFLLAVGQYVAQYEAQLLNRLLEQKTEYLDCHESPERNWQECICPNAEAVPVAFINEELTKVKGGK